MQELATRTIRTVHFFVESTTRLGLIVFRDVKLIMQFMRPMSERATILKGTNTCQLPILTHLSFILGFESFSILDPIIWIGKSFPWLLNLEIRRKF